MRFFFTRKILLAWLGLLVWLAIERSAGTPALRPAGEGLNLAFLAWMFFQSRRIFQWSEDLSARRRLPVLAQIAALLIVTGILLALFLGGPEGEVSARASSSSAFPIAAVLLRGILIFLTGAAAVILTSLAFYEAGTLRRIWTAVALGVLLTLAWVLPIGQGRFWIFMLGIVAAVATPWNEELGGRAKTVAFFGAFLAYLVAAVFQARMSLAEETGPILMAVLQRETGIFTAGFLRAVLMVFATQALIFQLKMVFSPVTRLALVRGGLRTKLVFFYLLAGAVPLVLMILVLSTGFYIVLGGYRASLGKRFAVELTEACRERAVLLAEDARVVDWAETSPTLGDSVSIDAEFSRFLEDVLAGGSWERPGQYLLAQVENGGLRRVACTRGTPETRRRGYPSPAWCADTSRAGLAAERDGVWGRAVAGRTLGERRLILEVGVPLGESFLEEMKALTGVDFELSNGYWLQVTIRNQEISSRREEIPESIPAEWRSVSTSSASDARPPGFLDRRLYFGGAFLPEIDWSTGAPLEKVAGMLLVRTSLRNLYRVLFSPENTINVLLLAIVGILAGLFLVIILVASGVGVRIVTSITRAVGALKKGTQRVRAGDFDYRIHVTSHDEFEDLADSFNVMSAEVRRMLSAVKEKERLESELRIAHSIQERLLPQGSPELRGYEICGRSTSAREVGGDYFDYLMFGGGSLGLAIGDVSGKGITAALLMANLQASLRAFAREPSGIAGVMEALNVQLHKTTSPEMYATFFYGILDAETGTFAFANAGHNPPLLVRSDGRIELLDAGGLPLGMMEGFPYEEAKAELLPGDVLVFYTDGVTEAEKSDGEQLGDEAFREVVVSNRHLGAREVRERIEATVRDFTAGHDPSDDLTLITLKVLEKF